MQEIVFGTYKLSKLAREKKQAFKFDKGSKVGINNNCITKDVLAGGKFPNGISLGFLHDTLYQNKQCAPNFHLAVIFMSMGYKTREKLELNF